MNTSWLVTSMFVGALLALAALSAQFIIRGARSPARFVWAVAMLATVLFSAALPFRESGGSRVASIDRQADIGAVTSAASTKLTAVVSVIASTPRGSLDHAVGLLSLSAAALAMALFALAYLHFARERKRWRQMLVLGTPVRVSSNVGPAAMGVMPAEIVLPQWLLTRPPAELRVVIAHELEHLRA